MTRLFEYIMKKSQSPAFPVNNLILSVAESGVGLCTLGHANRIQNTVD